jgi:hydrogenase nickel incorporation protein HypA/HybF
MHELALAEGIINIVESEKEKNGFDRVLEISLRIGEYSGVIPSCIEEFFPIAAKGTAAENAVLKIEWIPASFVCEDCGHTGAVSPHAACCAACGSTSIRMISGREFFVENIQVE